MSTRILVIAGTRSNCGKTTTALGVMAALVRRGNSVQPFKAGPDFIDPGHHATVTGRESHNLDCWMMGPDAVRDVFARHAADADFAVVEGVMGLYDGLSGADEDGSTAQLAKLLQAPVLLVADVSSMARSAAAMVAGYVDFDPDLTFAGVAFNRVGSSNHADLVREAMHPPGRDPVARVLGFLDRQAPAMPSRHLGLVTAQERELDPETVDALADWVERGLDLGRLMALCADPEIQAPNADFPNAALPNAARPERIVHAGGGPVRLAVARDQAFCFHYPENLRLLEQAGANLEFFSPLNDRALPMAHGLYLCGGYPEVHARELSANASMLASVREFAARGGVVYAECGGFMYLMRELVDAQGSRWPMAGIFDLEAAMQDRFKALGYREVVTRAESPLGPAWTMIRGHEFHYSQASGADEKAQAVYKVMDRKGWLPVREGLLKNNVLGSYVHLHLASNPEAAVSLVRAMSQV